MKAKLNRDGQVAIEHRAGVELLALVGAIAFRNNLSAIVREAEAAEAARHPPPPKDEAPKEKEGPRGEREESPRGPAGAEQLHPKLDAETMAKIFAMIGLLGSDNDGEVVAAARAIRRTLAAAGCTFADLKDALAQIKVRVKVVEKVVIVEKDVGSRNPRREMAKKLIETLEFMKAHEQEFVTQMYACIEADPDFSMTERQENWFNILYGRHMRSREAAA